MPLNLSALIRYKTLNNCFSSIRKYTMEELVDRCSEALSEYRGEPTGVSERTVREDIRNMRSDLLGFNAPIEQRDGYYYYSDRSYDLLNLFIREERLALEILMLLEDLRSTVEHPKLEKLIEELGRLLGHPRPTKEVVECMQGYEFEHNVDLSFLEQEKLYSLKKAYSRRMDQKPPKRKGKVSEVVVPEEVRNVLAQPAGTEPIRLRDVFELLESGKDTKP
jgi:predicted DNA-binding transcriptional regulator YafY